jgi:hypothetical protein
VPPIKQYVNVDPTNAVERPYGVDRKRVGRKIKLTAKLANKDEGGQHTRGAPQERRAPARPRGRERRGLRRGHGADRQEW